MNKENLISVILPVYNSEKYITESITSVLKQSLSNIELIIVDDGSTDNSRSICEKFAKQDDRVILMRNNHKGLTKSLNDAIKISKGKYIARQDADDISLPQRLEKQLIWFSNNDKKVLCGTGSKILKENNLYKKNWSITYKHNDIIKRLTYSNCFVHSSTMFIKEKAKKFGFYNEDLTYAQDYDLWWKLSMIGEVCNLKEELLVLRDRKDSISRSKSNEQTLDFIKSSIKYFAVKRKIIDFDENKEINFYENNDITINKLILLRFFYSDKLNDKIYLKDLNFRQLIQLFFFPFLLARKIKFYLRNLLK